MNAVDRQTAEAVELRAPGLSSRDSNVLSKLLGREDGKGDRGILVRWPAEFKGKLRAQDRIPTLRTLFEDLEYLELLASSMKLLIDPTAKQTPKHTFPKIFYDMNRNLAAVIGLSGCSACKTFLNWYRRRGRSQSV